MKKLHTKINKVGLFVLLFTGLNTCLTKPAAAQQFPGTNPPINEAYQFYQNGSYQKAINILQNALTNDSLQVHAYELLASAQLKLKRTALASMTIQDGLHYFPKQADLHWLLAESEFLSGDIQKAQLEYARLYRQFNQIKNHISLFNKDALRVRLYQTNLVMFKQAVNSENWDQARQYLHKASSYEPDSVGVAQNLVLTYLREKKWPETVSVTDSILNRYPGNHELMKLKAIALYHEKKYDKLLTIYHKLYSDNPSNLNYAVPYAELLAANGKMNESDKLYRQLLKKYPKNRDIYNSLLSMSEQHHSPIGEMVVLEKMRKQFPQDPKILDRLAAIYARMDSSVTERQYYDSLLTMTHDTVKYRLKTVQSYQRDKMDSTAYRIVSKLIRDYPENQNVLTTKGKLEMQLGKWHEALLTYRHLRNEEDDANVEKQLGKIFEKLQQPDSAAVHYQRAMDRSSRDPYVPYRLAVLTFPEDTSKSFDLTRFALNLSFSRLQVEQNKLKEQIQSNRTMAGLSNISQQSGKVHHYDTVASETFAFLTSHFPESKVLPLFNDLLNSYRGSGRLYTRIAGYYLNHGKKEKGLSLLQQAAEWTPKLLKTQQMLATYYADNGQIDKAIQVYKKVLALEPAKELPYQKLVDLYEKKHSLNALCDQWLLQFQTHRANKLLKQYLIEALDKAGRYNEAREISKESE